MNISLLCHVWTDKPISILYSFLLVFYRMAFIWLVERRSIHHRHVETDVSFAQFDCDESRKTIFPSDHLWSLFLFKSLSISIFARSVPRHVWSIHSLLFCFSFSCIRTFSNRGIDPTISLNLVSSSLAMWFRVLKLNNHFECHQKISVDQ